ncbi:hypothetical protein QQP08_027080 [Theobroma cacao]|nr:hypothetical protein QQP08_027080 [Theobroma cacao]
MDVQRVVVIQDASKEACSSAVRTKVDSSSKFGSNHRIVDREAARKEAYENNAEIIDLSKLYKAEKVEFRIEVAAGASPAVVALKSAEDLKATWGPRKKKIFSALNSFRHVKQKQIK